ncbi:unnamed protein product [Amoebophrya sp. A120]|nr:unnamed protein product [Amoebophrya sp. A120]|eukprot:GSA120T00020540001.1
MWVTRGRSTEGRTAWWNNVKTVADHVTQLGRDGSRGRRVPGGSKKSGTEAATSPVLIRLATYRDRLTADEVEDFFDGLQRHREDRTGVLLQLHDPQHVNAHSASRPLLRGRKKGRWTNEGLEETACRSHPLHGDRKIHHPDAGCLAGRKDAEQPILRNNGEETTTAQTGGPR